MEFGMQQSVCPRCGGTANVRTIQELMDMLGAMQDQAAMRSQQAQQRQRPGPLIDGSDSYGDTNRDPGQEIANAVLSLTGQLIGKAIGKRMRRTVVPAVEARAEQARLEQITIAERYPELRCCLSDQVIFLDGGTRVVPLADVATDITLARADAVVVALRAP